MWRQSRQKWWQSQRWLKDSSIFCHIMIFRSFSSCPDCEVIVSDFWVICISSRCETHRFHNDVDMTHFAGDITTVWTESFIYITGLSHFGHRALFVCHLKFTIARFLKIVAVCRDNGKTLWNLSITF